MNKCAESKNNIVPCAAAKTFEIKWLILWNSVIYWTK